MTAIEQMHSLLGIGARHITVSTVGIAPKIRRMADDKLQVSCCVRLAKGFVTIALPYAGWIGG